MPDWLRTHIVRLARLLAWRALEAEARAAWRRARAVSPDQPRQRDRLMMLHDLCTRAADRVRYPHGMPPLAERPDERRRGERRRTRERRR